MERAVDRVSDRYPGGQVGAAWVVRTKLQPPPLRPDLVPRPRLVAALVEAVTERRLTLLAAPAGSGKTTLLAALPAALPGLPLAWLGLDEEDDEPARFLAGLIAALGRLAPAVHTGAGSLLASLPDPADAVRRLVGVLADDLAAGLAGPAVLVIDDLHLATAPAIHAGLDHLLALAPRPLHLVIASRHDPPLALSRLRARRDLAEIRLDDLRFTEEETAAFARVTAGLDLTGPEVALLWRRGEGWAAGLSLLAAALAGRPSAAGRAALLAGPAADRHLVAYLADEVLDAQPPPVRDFLLRTAVLTELTPAACVAATGREEAPALLAEVQRRNLFVTALDADTARYHDLFRDALRRRLAVALPPAEVRLIHRRVAAAERVPERALRHWLAAEAWEEAATGLVTLADDLLARGALDTLAGWLALLPPTVRAAHPRLTMYLGVCAAERWRLAEARALLMAAAEGCAAGGDAAGAGEAAAYLATTLSTLGDLAGARAASDRARTAPLAPATRVRLALGRAWQALAAGAAGAVGAALDEAVAAAEAAPEPRAIRHLATQVHLPFGVLPGGLARLERLDRLVGGEPGPGEAAALGWRAFARLWRGDLAAAIGAGERSAALHARFDAPLLARLDTAALLPVCHALAGDGERAAALFAGLFAALAEPAVRGQAAPWLPILLCLRARAAWLVGDQTGPAAAAADLAALPPGGEWWPLAAPSHRIVAALVALVDNRPAAAEAALREAAAGQRAAPGSTLAGDARLLLAHVLLGRGRRADALAVLAAPLAEYAGADTPGALLYEGRRVALPLLRLAVEQGQRRAFAAAALALLEPSRSGQPGGVVVPGTGEALSPREVEVLGLLADGAGNAAIAAALTISVNTVKRHVASVLDKLGAANRGEAVARARQLGLL